jgi:hypothetical protein
MAQLISCDPYISGEKWRSGLSLEKGGKHAKANVLHSKIFK